MNILDLPELQKKELMNAIHRWVYPLYFITPVEDYEYQFVGTSFVFELSERKFVVFSEHQYKVADGNQICTYIPDRLDAFLGLPKDSIFRFPEYDLAICEIHGEALLKKYEAIPAICVSVFDQDKSDFLYAITGYRQIENRIKYDSKTISPIYGSIITSQAVSSRSSLKLDISNEYALIGSRTTKCNDNSIEEITQGLSGSPVFGLKLNEYEPKTNQGMLDLEFLGVVTHVAENTGTVYAVHSMDFLSCLESAYGVFKQFRDENGN